MRQIDLVEYEKSEPQPLSASELGALLREAGSLDLSIAPVTGESGMYNLTPGSTVGAVEMGGLSVLIRPKIGIQHLLSLACYAIGKVKFQSDDFNFPDEYALPDALALALASHARRAFSRGLLHGYREEEEALHTVRGRIRFDEQIRRRFGVPLPVEVRYDEYTADIPANRLVKAAASRLGAMRLRSPAARRGLGWIAGMLENVAPIEFPPNRVPDIELDRLNDHYRGVLALSRLVLRHGALEADRGAVRASGFLMDMNVVFQEFVTTALREALGVSPRVFLEKSIPSLDEEGKVHLRPDLTWWQGGTCLFVGDAKYKRISDRPVPNADLYQLLAYATALGLPGGMLIYAQGEAEPIVHEVRHSGKRLEVAALDVSGTLEQVLSRVKYLARTIRERRNEALGLSTAA